LALCLLLPHAVNLLEPADELVALARDRGEVVIRELPPAPLDLALGLLPVASNLLPVNSCLLPRGGDRWPWSGPSVTNSHALTGKERTKRLPRRRPAGAKPGNGLLRACGTCLG
jgi:hypothetical protein